MAEALFNASAIQKGLPFKAKSAGTAPSDHVHPNVVAAMQELGLDLSTEQPKLLSNDMVKEAAKVITMGCEVDAETCPAVFTKGVEDWQLPDPNGRSLEDARLIRDAIVQRVELLLASMPSHHS